jgi:hypothetical protein
MSEHRAAVECAIAGCTEQTRTVHGFCQVHVLQAAGDGTILHAAGGGTTDGDSQQIESIGGQDSAQKETREHEEDTPATAVKIVNKRFGLEEHPGWLEVEIQDLEGKCVQLLVHPQATALQMKRAIAQAEGTPAFQQALWVEGAEEEMQNMSTASQSSLTDQCTVFLIKGDAASWQLVVLTEPELFEALGDFMALSLWREEGGYEQAGKAMEAVVAEWVSMASDQKLDECELLRRKVVVGRFYVDCGGQFERAIPLLSQTAEQVDRATNLNEQRVYAAVNRYY